MQRRSIINEDQDARTTGELSRYPAAPGLNDRTNPPSRWSRISTAPLFLLLVGTMGGTFLTYYYSSRQAAIQSERSFADEFNKIRLNKTGEVWEKVYLYEAAVDGVMQEFNVKLLKNDGASPPDLGVQIPPGRSLVSAVQQFEGLYAEVIEILNKDRFWITEEDYRGIKEYADTTYDYCLAKRSGTITKEKEAQRDRARANLTKIREKMSKESHQASNQ